MTKPKPHEPTASPQCAGPRCERQLPGPARTGRPGLYCGQACRQAALRQRRLAEQAPQLQEEAWKLLEGIGPELAAEVMEQLQSMDGEQLALVVRHARAVVEHQAALCGALGVLPDRTGLRPVAGGEVPTHSPRPAGRGPRPGPGQQPVPAGLLGLFLEPHARPADAGHPPVA
ncbi:hypothetical protein [Kitasatospora sp. NPDC057223]|uniref:hypothetical protein n=1 Tax=Kitasatospora sp. NPDC057223 TaxID=3346055 RepID=UPI0036258C22